MSQDAPSDYESSDQAFRKYTYRERLERMVGLVASGVQAHPNAADADLYGTVQYAVSLLEEIDRYMAEDYEEDT